ncbi:hypothetical protein BDP27DRAFT_1432576 [Rhodocollybia butyracea]|uniref:F-box domain-containing protein n=1 Tax=Rhodocollybia butyracea TaxID=206335 RepID=A0A9P5P8L7_9AGAR|nr:hypothetical protein BDP27DRAFT_1432576 [Rhodocollybia butyracea]
MPAFDNTSMLFQLPSTPHCCPKLLEQYLEGQCFNDLCTCRLVSKEFQSASDRLLFRKVDLRDKYQYKACHRNEESTRYTKEVVVPLDFTQEFYALHIRSGFLRVRSLEIVAAGNLLGPPLLLNVGICSLYRSLEGFITQTSVHVSYPDFLDLLDALHSCKGLRQLTLPSPYTLGKYMWYKPLQGLSDARNALAQRTTTAGASPKLNFLQLVSVSHRQNPIDWHHDIDLEWLCNKGFPFNVSEVHTLVVGSPAAARYLLPLTAIYLRTLELCVPTDFRHQWNGFCKLHSSLIVTRSDLPAKPFQSSAHFHSTSLN